MKKEIKENKSKYVTQSTFEKHMRSIANSFDGLNKSMDGLNKSVDILNKAVEGLAKAVTGIIQQMNVMKDDVKEIRKTLGSFVSDVSSHDRKIENLTIRVEKLEERNKA